MDTDFIVELFAPFGPVTVRRLFGGAGLYRDGVMFALVHDGAIFLKVDDADIRDFEREGSAPFAYTTARGRTHAFSYWRLPERLYDDPEELAAWAQRAFAIAERGKAVPRKRVRLGPKPPAKRKAPGRRR